MSLLVRDCRAPFCRRPDRGSQAVGSRRQGSGFLCALRNKFLVCKLADPARELDLVSEHRDLVLDSDFLVLEFLISISIREYKDKEGSNFIANHGYFSGQEPRIHLTDLPVRDLFMLGPC
jgi:hypothetical protein